MRPMPTSRWALLLMLLSSTGCEPKRTPPRYQAYAGLPVSGSLTDAQRAGFSACLNDTAVTLRCRRHGVMLFGQGPYEAAVDLVGGSGNGGFDQLTLWHDTDQYAVYKVADTLERQGWRRCYTGKDDRGDQAIYTRAGAPVRIQMDLSYWAKRRLRVIPVWNCKEQLC
jgi:hypothetical protein